MLNIHYPDSDLQIIQHDRYHHEHPAIRKRMTILALHRQGIVGEQLCQLAAAAHNTVYALLRSYRDGGLKNVYQYDKHKPVSQLEEYSEQIVKEFTERPSVSINEAGNRIETLFGIIMMSECRPQFSKKKGCKYLKACGIPSKADFAEQKKFHNETLQPLITESLSQQCVFIFYGCGALCSRFLSLLFCSLCYSFVKRSKAV